MISNIDVRNLKAALKLNFLSLQSLVVALPYSDAQHAAYELLKQLEFAINDTATGLKDDS